VHGRRNEAEDHGDVQIKDLAERELSTWSLHTLSSKGVDGRSWIEAVGRESMAVMTRRSSEKEKSSCLGLLPSSSCRLSETSSKPNEH